MVAALGVLLVSGVSLALPPAVYWLTSVPRAPGDDGTAMPESLIADQPRLAPEAAPTTPKPASPTLPPSSPPPSSAPPSSSSPSPAAPLSPSPTMRY